MQKIQGEEKGGKGSSRVVQQSSYSGHVVDLGITCWLSCGILIWHIWKDAISRPIRCCLLRRVCVSGIKKAKTEPEELKKLEKFFAVLENGEGDLGVSGLKLLKQPSPPADLRFDLEISSIYPSTGRASCLYFSLSHTRKKKQKEKGFALSEAKARISGCCAFHSSSQEESRSHYSCHSSNEDKGDRQAGAVDEKAHESRKGTEQGGVGGGVGVLLGHCALRCCSTSLAHLDLL